MPKIQVKEVNIDEIVSLNNSINEFHGGRGREYFEAKYKDSENLKIVGYINGAPAGYILAYDRYKDGSLYCWMAAVSQKFRRMGVLTSLMNYQSDWAKDNGYLKIRIKTRNKRREMLSYLVKNGFNFTEIDPRPDILENRIFLEKEIK